MKFVCVFLLLFCILSVPCRTEEGKADIETENSVVFSKPGLRGFFIASTEILGVNFAVNAFDSIVLNADFAKTNPSFMWKHLSSGEWEFDQSSFAVNQFAHPYAGSLYFNAGRANGFNFYQSFLFSAGGSLFWELFMETSLPSINDMIVTPFAGALYGEMLHRLFLSTKGRLKPLTWFISPQDAFNRFVTGTKAPEVSGGVESLELFFGVDLFSNFIKFSDTYDNAGGIDVPVFATGIKAVYGDPYAHKTEAPLDQFTLDLSIAGFIDSYCLRVFANGLLYSVPILTEGRAKSTFGVEAAYNVIFASDIHYATAAGGAGIKQLIASVDEKWSFKWEAFAGWDIINATENNYYMKQITNYKKDSKRTYDYYTGAYAGLGIAIENRRFGTFQASVHGDFLFKLPDGKSGYGGALFVQYADIGYEHALWKNFSIGVRDFIYHKWNLYGDAPHVEFISNNVRLYGKAVL